MSSKIQIICTKPGMRRNGIEHPASAIYAANHWSEDELKAFAADPSFIVQPVSSGGVLVESVDIEAAVVARVEVAKAALQADFDAAKEKLQADFARTVEVFRRLVASPDLLARPDVGVDEILAGWPRPG